MNTDELNRQIESLLRQQLGRIRQRFLIHGLGSFLASVCLILAVYYLLDRYVRLPGGVRILLTLLVAAWLVFLLRRLLVYPLTRSITQRDVALAFEQRFPDLRQKLISAIQLAGGLAQGGDAGLRNQSRSMIEQVVADAARHASRIPHDELLTARRTTRVWTGAGALLALVLGFAFARPELSGVFLARILGLPAEYPRQTNLLVLQPTPTAEPSAEYSVRRDGRRIDVTLAAGGDLPVIVGVDGVEPREVLLVVSGGRGLPPTIAMAGRGPARFKHTFRRVSGDFEFFARGGDDYFGDATVAVRVIHPPQVRTIETRTEYPAYTGLLPTEQEGGSLEALSGSRIGFRVSTTTDRVREAKIRFLESGQVLDLEPVEVTLDDGGKRTVYSGTLTITRSDRYQVELIGTQGLRNPHPGTYHIVATPDHPPIGQLLSPLDDGLNVALPDGIVPIRISARDDFGITGLDAECQVREGQEALRIPMFRPEPNAPPAKRCSGLTLVDLAKPEYRAMAVVGQSLVLTGKLLDNRQPEAQGKDVGPRQVQVIGETDLLRRISGHFRRIKEDVDQNLALLRDRHGRLLDLVEEFEQGAAVAAMQLPITAVEVAQGRIQTAAGRIHVELMRAFNFHLFNRLETSAHAAAVLTLFEQFHAAVAEPRQFHEEFYRDIADRRQQGRLGVMDKSLDPILAMLGSADRIAHTLSPEAIRSLSAARVAERTDDAVTVLQKAVAAQRTMLEEFEALVKRLDAWNEFQDVITNTRALLDQQREIETRTKTLPGGKEK